jgi:RNA polymerase sigma factor (sigma-70 family)
MSRYRVEVLAGLARQLAYAPLTVRGQQLSAAESFLLTIDPNATYSYADIVEAITSYRPRKDDGTRLPGRAVQHDISILIEEVSDSMDVSSSSLAEPVLSIEDVTERFNVTSKTIQRWRKRGLVSRRFIFPDGRRRVGFLLSSIERFISTNSETVERGANFTQVNLTERDAMLRDARRLATRCRCCVREITRRLARRYGRSPLTVLHTVKKFDSENPKEAIFTRAPREMKPATRQRVARAVSRGVPLTVLSRRLNVTRSAIYQAAIDARIERLQSLRIKFHDDPIFHGPDAESQIRDLVQAAERAATPADPVRIPRGLSPYLQSLYHTQLLSPALERALFLAFNYYKSRFVQLRRRFDPETARKRELDALDRALADARAVKNRIISANLRLVVSTARRHMQPGLSLMELISEGNVILMRAVDGFDVGRNFRFSTYGTFALAKGFARLVPQMRNTRTGSGELVSDLPDRRDSSPDALSRRDEVEKLLSRLDIAERTVIAARFGLAPADSVDALGLSRPRLRLLERVALDKLRLVAGTPN